MKRTSLILAVVLFCGCAAAAARPVTMKFRELKNGAFAASSAGTQQIVVATSADVYRRIWDVLIGAGAAPEADFSHESVIFLVDRQRNTGGYALEPKSIGIDGSVATVVVKLRAPQPGSVTTQVITTPFAVIAVPSHAIKVAHWKDEASGNVVAKSAEQP